MSPDFLHATAHPTPVVAAERAEEFLRERFDVRGTLRELGSQQDANFRVDSPSGERYVLKISSPATRPAELRLQHLAIARVLDAEPDLRLPEVCLGVDGSDLQDLRVGSRTYVARLLRYVDGSPIMDSRYLAPTVVARLGDVAARVVRALEGVDDRSDGRDLQWDLRQGGEVVASLSAFVADEALRARLTAVAASAVDALGPLAAGLPVQVIHGDITDNNIVCQIAADGRPMPVGVIDFGDVARSWRVAELAVTCTSLLHHHGAGPASILPAVRAFHRVQPLGAAEADALWPLVVLRACVLVVSGYRQVALEDNAYAAEGLERELRMFETAAVVPPEVMRAAIRHALAMPEETSLAAATPLLAGFEPGGAVVLDLSVHNDDLHGGRWLDDSVETELFADAVRAGAAAVIARHGEFRLTRAHIDRTAATPGLALGLEVVLARSHTVQAPWSGTLSRTVDDVVLRGSAGPALILRGLTDAVATGHVDAGARIGSAGGAGAPALDIQLSWLQELPPRFVTPDLADGWLAACPDPAPLLGLPARGAGTADSGTLLARRDEAFATVQEHYFPAPPQVERGWRHHLVDVQGQTYLDTLNNVTLLGHGHPGLSDAVHAQWRRLNTNSRFHYASVVEFSERLSNTLPDGLDTVFLVNSGSEANDLALRLAWAYTGRRDVVAVGEAYHGWTDATDAISTSIQDNPDAVGTRPSWVHTVAAPNTYRGQYRGAEAHRYAEDATAVIDGLVVAGRAPAAFLCEPYYGNAGGMALPDGYLEAVYGAIRAANGVCIADEVQVGYGRLGSWFWGFEQQGAVPDVVTVAKGMGNGHPLGAVITRREIAEGFRSQGYFFSSAGGSPVSSVVGLAVLDAVRDERLQENARDVGGYLRDRLLDLAERHPIIGAVHGAGLYLGVEFVRDRDTREPATAETAVICERLLELGVIVQPTSDRMCVLKIKPPLCFTRASADVFAAALDDALTHGW